MTRFVMRMVPERAEWLPYMLQNIPGLEYVLDLTRNPLDTFMRWLLHIEDDPAVHLEDDVILTSDFLTKIEAEIGERPGVVQQFFSLRKRDLELGSRWMPGGTFCMLQCTYFPAGYAGQIYDYYPRWPGQKLHRTTADLFVGGFLSSRREKYRLHVPSLVQHRVTRSVIDPRRSSRRQSPSFEP